MHIIGLDFSGARNAGEKTWVCSARVDDEKLRVDLLMPAWKLPQGAVDRASAHAAVREWIAVQDGALVGCDFPFSLPQSAIPEASWIGFARSFEDRFPTPELFRAYGDAAALRAREAGVPVARMTDTQAKTPFAPHNLRIYRQTYYGLRDLLAPLCLDEVARVVPMQDWLPGHNAIIEVCPASLLKTAGLYAPYKGREQMHRSQRERLLDYAQENGVALTDPQHVDMIISDTEADALDSVLCALAALRSLPELPGPHAEPYRIEGRVFGW